MAPSHVKNAHSKLSSRLCFLAEGWESACLTLFALLGSLNVLLEFYVEFLRNFTNFTYILIAVGAANRIRVCFKDEISLLTCQQSLAFLPALTIYFTTRVFHFVIGGATAITVFVLLILGNLSYLDIGKHSCDLWLLCFAYFFQIHILYIYY